MELQGRYSEITRQGLGLVAISYDPPATLEQFARSRGITFPLVSDAGSAIIRRFGILNEQQEPKARGYGVPHPGTFIIDRQGMVTARFFEEAYQERYTVSTILARGGVDSGSGIVTARTPQVSLRAAISESSVAPGERIAGYANIEPGKGMHVYAPGKHDYQVVQLTIDPQPWLRAHQTAYPAAEVYHFKPLDERVNVYSRPFRLVRELTVLASPEMQKLLASKDSVTITGALEYQACDDRVCYNPARVPFTFTVATKPLDRRPPGG